MWENRLWTEMLWRSCGYFIVVIQSVVTMGGRRGFRFVLFGLRWIVLYW